MKFLAQVFVIIITGYVLAMFLPWWSVALAAFAGGLIFNTNANFLAGFLSAGLLWVTKAWLVDTGAVSNLSERVALLLQVQQKAYLLLLMFVLIGLVGGFASMTGSALRKKKKKSYYY